MTLKPLLLLGTTLVLMGCTPQTNSDNTADGQESQIPTVKQAALKAHIEFLAHDLLEGRDTGSRGYDISAQYVASHFAQFGLKPAGIGAGYFQPVTFRKRQLKPSSAELTFTSNNGEIKLNYPEQFMSSGSSIATETSVTAPMAFLGYGISAPHLNHDDYADIDVKDKIVVLLMGYPETFPSEQGAHFSNSRVKAETAAKKGAVGIIYLPTPKSERRYSYARMMKNAGRPSFSWVDDKGAVSNSFPEIKGSAIISIETAKTLFNDEKISFDQIVELAENNEPLPGFTLKYSATLATETTHEETLSYNIAGIVEGTDPVLKNEYVIYSAHLDHIGIHGDEGESDTINNGALDNAAGTSIMIETARIFSQRPAKRSILFIAVTGEEKGLLGSDYFSRHPTVPIEQIIANVNIDMPLILYPIGDVIAFGAEHSSMGNYVQRAAEKIGLQLSPDPMPEQNIFVRSDHYSFVKQGVPSVFLIPGFKSLDESIDGGEIFRKFLAEHYHQASDETDLPINYEAGAKFTQVNFLIGEEIANSANTPKWHEGNFFGDLFSKQ